MDDADNDDNDNDDTEEEEEDDDAIKDAASNSAFVTGPPQSAPLVVHKNAITWRNNGLEVLNDRVHGT